MKRLFLTLLLMARIGHAADAPTPETIKHRITGLFEPTRADQLRALFKDHPKVKLLNLDFARAEGTFSYDPKTYSFADFDLWMHERTFHITPATKSRAIARQHIGHTGCGSRKPHARAIFGVCACA